MFIHESPMDVYEFPLCASVPSCETLLFLQAILRRETRIRNSKDSGCVAG